MSVNLNNSIGGVLSPNVVQLRPNAEGNTAPDFSPQRPVVDPVEVQSVGFSTYPDPQLIENLSERFALADVESAPASADLYEDVRTTLARALERIELIPSSPFTIDRGDATDEGPVEPRE